MIDNNVKVINQALRNGSIKKAREYNSPDISRDSVDVTFHLKNKFLLFYTLSKVCVNLNSTLEINIYFNKGCVALEENKYFKNITDNAYKPFKKNK